MHLCRGLTNGRTEDDFPSMISSDFSRQRIVVLASGSGSNAQRLVEFFRLGQIAEVVAILTDNPSAYVIQRGNSLGVDVMVLNKEVVSSGSALKAILMDLKADWVVLAGYLKLIPHEVVESFQGRIVNIHPALLPAFGGKGMYGMRVHEAVLASGVKETGITIHHVNQRYDEGAPIFQAKIPVVAGLSPEQLAQQVHALEHRHYPEVLNQLIFSQLSDPHMKKVKSALISVYHKDGLDEIAKTLHGQGVQLISTGGTATFLRGLNLPVTEVSDLTDFPEILGGRVKTLHPAVFGGILARRALSGDLSTLAEHNIPEVDVVIVDLYPFESTVSSGASEQEIIEKIDIGGISLIRAAAKNFQDVVCVPSRAHYGRFLEILTEQQGFFTLEQRKQFASEGFDISSHYDTQIFRYLSGNPSSLKVSEMQSTPLRYGENPHQQATFFGDLDAMFRQLNGKALSYNNLLDMEAAMGLWEDFQAGAPFFGIFKHTNPCGVATGSTLLEAWERALACDPVSAFGGILICNGQVEEDVAIAVDEIFFEVLIADGFSTTALERLSKKKNRILLQRVSSSLPSTSLRSSLHGYLLQDKDKSEVNPAAWEQKTSHKADAGLYDDIAFGEKVGKHLKSNAIAIVKNQQLIGSGAGQTSRVDALKQAIAKALEKGFSLEGAILYSDAFFPFKDCAELSLAAGIRVLAEPGGSIRDQETIEYCETHDMSLIFTQYRHFRH